jgi:hypothetical protein
VAHKNQKRLMQLALDEFLRGSFCTYCRRALRVSCPPAPRQVAATVLRPAAGNYSN